MRLRMSSNSTPGGMSGRQLTVVVVGSVLVGGVGAGCAEDCVGGVDVRTSVAAARAGGMSRGRRTGRPLRSSDSTHVCPPMLLRQSAYSVCCTASSGSWLVISVVVSAADAATGASSPSISDQSISRSATGRRIELFSEKRQAKIRASGRQGAKGQQRMFFT